MAPSSTSYDGPDRVEAKAVQTGKSCKSWGLPTKNRSEKSSAIDIVDIRHDAVEINLKEEILTSLKPRNGPKTMPTLLLYDERGLQIFEEVNTSVI
jgi:hypothetical protein